MIEITAPMAATVVRVAAQVGEAVPRGRAVVVLESMKMEHLVEAPDGGVVGEIFASPGDVVEAGDLLMRISPQVVRDDAPADDAAGGVERADLQAVRERRARRLDSARPDAVARMRSRGHRTARENLADLADDGSFEEYGGLAHAAQAQRRGLDELLTKTAADGFIGGTARVNGDLFGDEAARCVLLSYDYTVIAGTQGYRGHRKMDRLFELALGQRLPVIFDVTGGGGRPGDTDYPVIAGLDVRSFASYARLSGQVPLVSLVLGPCFAGNAALAGCSDVIIATPDATLGMGGPAMIEGGGLGTFTPDAIGPVDELGPAGVVDIVADDDADACRIAKQYLGYPQGSIENWQCEDQALLRSAIPENRVRAYDARAVISLIADHGSVLELRRAYAPGMITAFARVEGRPIGVLCNNPAHLGGAIDPPGADKAAGFIDRCNAYGLPILFLCDTPGFMVGPETERSGQVRHAAKMFLAAARLRVPYFTVVLRKGYGLGAQAMAGGSFQSPMFVVSWPTGEFGAMGIEGAVRLAMGKELENLPEDERAAAFDELVAKAYERGRALNMAAHLEIDDVIDPATTRRRIVNALRSARAPAGQP